MLDRLIPMERRLYFILLCGLRLHNAHCDISKGHRYDFHNQNGDVVPTYKLNVRWELYSSPSSISIMSVISGKRFPG
jgi:hypothetical protein